MVEGAALLTLAAELVLKLWRASIEASLWMDEVLSLELANRRPAQIIEIASADYHPPFYYLLLKAWLHIWKRAEVAPTLLLARSLNVGVWCLLILLAYLLARQLRGGRWALLLAVVLGTNANLTQYTQDLRSDGLTASAVTLVFMSSVVFLIGDQKGRRSSLAAWTLPCAIAVATWAHLLTGLLSALLVAGLWLAATRAHLERNRRNRYLAAAALGFLAASPWALIAGRQVAALAIARPDWMTPATSWNLVRVFLEWLPLGRAGAEPTLPQWLGIGLGAIALTPALLIAGCILRRRYRDEHPHPDRDRIALAFAGLVVVFVFVGLLWALQRADWIRAFYGPRYPCLMAGIWLAAVLVGFAELPRTRRSMGGAGLGTASIVIASFVGQANAVRADLQGPLSLSSLREVLGSSTGQLYIAPGELSVYIPRTMRELGARSVSTLYCAPPPNEEATILDLNRWNEAASAQDLVLKAAIENNLLGSESTLLRFPATKDFRIARIGRLDRALLSTWCPPGPHPTPWELPPEALSTALPETQSAADGWSYLEFDKALHARRWSAAPQTVLRFDRAVAPGNYTLDLVGYRYPFPTHELDLLVATESGNPLKVRVGSGEFHRTVPLRVDPSDRPGEVTLRVHHPLWRPATMLNSSDPRALGFQLEWAAIRSKPPA